VESLRHGGTTLTRGRGHIKRLARLSSEPYSFSLRRAAAAAMLDSYPATGKVRIVPQSHPAEEGTTWGAARVLDVLEFLGRRNSPAAASIIASSCNIPRSSTYGLLNLLKSRRFVAYRPTERAWTLGSAAFELSADAPLFAHGLAVLRAFATVSSGLTLHHIASASGLSRTAVACILPSLVESDLLHADPDGTYSLGLELVGLASRVGWVDRLRLAARMHLVRLRDATQETANLIILDGDHAIYVDQVESPYALRHSGWAGRRIPLAGTATGAAFEDRGTSHAVADAVELGVTAIACAIQLPGYDAAVGITAPSWRIEEFGVPRAQGMVEAVSREIAMRLRA